jgi:hypothetical protein
VSHDWTGTEVDYDDGFRLGTPGRMDRLFARESWIAVLFLLMLSGCCLIAPLAALAGGLGLLVCQTYEARTNAALLLAAAAGHAVLFWALVLNVYVL